MTGSRGVAGSTGRRRLFGLAAALVFLALIAWTVRGLGPRRVIEVARQADATWLALSMLPLAGRFLLWGVKWKRVLDRRAPVPYAVALRTLMAGAFVNLTTPTAKLGGGVLRAVFLNRRYGWGAAPSYGRALVDQIGTALGTMALFGLLASGVGLLRADLDIRGSLMVAGLVTLGVLVTALTLRPLAWRRIRDPAVERFARRRLPAALFRLDPDRPVPDWLYQVFYPLLGEGGAFVTLGSDVLLGAASFFSLCLANAFVLRALGVDADLATISTAVVLGYFGGSLIGAWGGIGVTEAMLAALFVRIGIAPETAAAATLLHRASFYAFVLLFGGMALAIENRTSRPRGGGYSPKSARTPV